MDLSDLVRENSDRKERMQSVQQHVAKSKTWSGKSRIRLSGLKANIVYAVPDAKEDGNRKPSFTMLSIRALVINAVDSLIILQERENERLKTPY